MVIILYNIRINTHMPHNPHQIPKVIALSLAVLVMIPIAKNWQTMAGSLHDIVSGSVGQLIENIDAN